MHLKEKVALVTGGSDGLGLAISSQLLSTGTTVHICGRTQKTLLKAQSKLASDKLFIHRADVSDYQQVKDLVSQVDSIDILINNAGVWKEGPIESFNQNDVDTLIDINLKSSIYTSLMVLPQMKQRNSGVIVNVSSTSGFEGRDQQAVYCASKFGLRGFTDALIQELWNTNINVIGFYPGGMKTSLFVRAGQNKDLETYMDPDRVAKILVFALEQSNSSLVLNHLIVNRRAK